MNGMEGPYSQILINSRPIFSGLAGVYGLELIPSNMIEKVEVVRGGGSALYGSNAIAGTVNIILKDPKTDIYEAGVNYAFTGVGTRGSGGVAPDYSVNFNGSVVSDDLKSGVSVYGFTRKREKYDANDDSFSEIAPLKNVTFGGRAFHRFSFRDRLAVDFFAIHEQRDGGNKQELPLHERDIAEAVTHDLQVASLSYERYYRDYDLLSVYVSGQHLNRASYYGAEQSLSDYGNSVDYSYNAGVQYKAVFGNASVVSGVESTGGFLLDEKLGYPDLDNATIDPETGELVVEHIPNTLIADQSSVTTGVFTQYDVKIHRLKLSAGARYDHYVIEDKAHEGEEPKTGDVFSPRLSLMVELLPPLQARVSYSQGYRAPQIFDEDLHIETSGSRQVIHENDPDLKQETSHSVMASLDYNNTMGSTNLGFLAEGFYTRLVDAFANEYGEPDEDGTVVYTRVNAKGGATVAGVNMELKLKPAGNLSLTSGFTLQTSNYDEAQDFEETRFFRTPNDYGYLALSWDVSRRFCLNTTGNYSGKMLVPYFGPEIAEGELRTSDRFFDMGLKLSYTVKLNGASLEFAGGVKNIFNSYQSDFDTGIDRDPAYVYGPMAPRTAFVSLRFGNLLNQ
jgi:outer membrane receptor for ferrienterochelin and colicins